MLPAIPTPPPGLSIQPVTTSISILFTNLNTQNGYLSCPIDLEPFVLFWSDELQEFIWTDAIRIGDRIYHASCYRQAIADRAKAATPVGIGGSGRMGTPDSVLGKRKAEVRTFN